MKKCVENSVTSASSLSENQNKDGGCQNGGPMSSPDESTGVRRRRSIKRLLRSLTADKLPTG